MMRIAVYGAGSVGGYFGGRLAQAGEEVVFIARGEHLKAIRLRGLRIDSPNGDFSIDPAQATDDPRKAGEVEAVLVGVKAWQVPEAAQAMKPMVGKQTFVVPLENGVEAPAQLAQVLGQEQVLGGMCRISAAIVSPGHIRHVGMEPYIAFGELDRQPSPRAERLRDAFTGAGVRAEVPLDIQVTMWEKFIFIVAISGVGAVTRLPIDVARSLPETRQMLEGVMQEVYDVARKRQVALTEETIPKTLALIDSLPAGSMPSMMRDILNRKPSELAFQNGAVVRMGREANLATPVNAFIYASLLPQELRARGEFEAPA
jgi:2-dehydropantoate 2-reductase